MNLSEAIKTDASVNWMETAIRAQLKQMGPYNFAGRLDAVKTARFYGLHDLVKEMETFKQTYENRYNALRTY